MWFRSKNTMGMHNQTMLIIVTVVAVLVAALDIVICVEESMDTMVALVKMPTPSRTDPSRPRPRACAARASS